MRIVVAPQEFKGSLSAREAAEAIAAGARDAMVGAEIDVVPMSDGGAGLVDALLSARGGESVITNVHDPIMRRVDAAWALLADGSAAIEMAAASGLVLLRDDERDPLVATTYGSGELIAAALDRGCTNIIVGVGGSATIDGGAGAMQALGARLLDGPGKDLGPGAGPLAELARIDLSHRHAGLAEARVRIASDVTNTLCGAQGAAAMFGPQKGARPEDITRIDEALGHFAEIVRRDCGTDVLEMPGSGAGGGLGVGIMAVAPHVTIEPGFRLVAGAVGLEERIAGADLVITGEGRLDAQTAFGKTAAGVAQIARAHSKRVVAIAGSVTPGYDGASSFDRVEVAMPAGMEISEAMRRARDLVREAARRAVAALVDR